MPYPDASFFQPAHGELVEPYERHPKTTLFIPFADPRACPVLDTEVSGSSDQCSLAIHHCASYHEFIESNDQHTAFNEAPSIGCPRALVSGRGHAPRAAGSRLRLGVRWPRRREPRSPSPPPGEADSKLLSPPGGAPTRRGELDIRRGRAGQQRCPARRLSLCAAGRNGARIPARACQPLRGGYGSAAHGCGRCPAPNTSRHAVLHSLHASSDTAKPTRETSRRLAG